MTKILTANRLRDGEAVYLTAAGDWSETLHQAWPVETAADARTLEQLGAAAETGRLVVGSYVMPVAVADGHLVPLSARERIRAAGPTSQPDVGKQSRAAV